MATADPIQKIDPTAPDAERWKRYRTDQFLEAVTVYACPRCDREFPTSEECRAHIRGCRKASANG